LADARAAVVAYAFRKCFPETIELISSDTANCWSDASIGRAAAGAWFERLEAINYPPGKEPKS